MPYKDPGRQRKYQRERNARIRREWLQENGPCAQCGNAENLNVDHVDPETKISHNVWSWSKSRREAELAKCQVLCQVCHFAKTGRENSIPPKNGKLWCTGCQDYRQPDSFFRSAARDGAREGYFKECKECRNKIKKAYRQKRRDAGLSYT